LKFATRREVTLRTNVNVGPRGIAKSHVMYLRLYSSTVTKSKRQVPFLRVPVIKPEPEPTNAREKGNKNELTNYHAKTLLPLFVCLIRGIHSKQKQLTIINFIHN